MAPSATTGNRPRPLTILAAAFLAGGAAAVGLNYFLDVHLSQRKPVVESEPIFIAMRSLPAGAPVTVWDVALRNWPKAMLPTTAMRVEDSFEGMMLKMPIREGQPLLSVQLEPTLAIAKNSAGINVEDGGMVAVDDRTKVQVSWPSKPAKATTVPVEPAATALPTPTAQLGVIATENPAVATEPVPSTIEEVVEVASPEASLVAASNAAVSETIPTDPVPAVVPLPETNDVAAATPAPVVPVEETVAVAPAVAEPVIAEPTIAEPIAEPIATTQPQPTAAIASVPAPVVPAVPTIVQSQRHLVIPERIAVMVDDVTPTPTAPSALSDNTSPPSALRKVTPPATTTATETRQPAANTSLSERDALSAAMRPNPLRPSTVSPAAARPIVTPVVPTTPVESRVQPQASLNVPRVVIPRNEITPSRTGRDGSATTPNAADANADSRMFPRVSARMEKAGQDWNRFRDSIFGSSEEESTGSNP